MKPAKAILMIPDSPDNNSNIPPEIRDLYNSGQISSSDIDPLQKFRGELIQSAPTPREHFQSELAEKLQSEFIQQRHHSSHQSSVSVMRFLVRPVLVIVIIVVFGSGIVLAINTLVQQFIDRDDGLSSAEGVELNLINTVDNFTLHLEWAHLDNNRLTIGFTVSGFDCSSDQYLFCDVGVRLVDHQQVELNEISSQGESEGTTRSYLYNFDVSPLLAETTVLPLQLEVNPFGVELSEASPTDSGVIETTRTSLNVSIPLTFSVSTNPQTHILNTAQHFTDNGHTLSLRRVIITATQTRITVCFVPPESDRTWTMIPYLTADEAEVAGGGAVQPIAGIGEATGETCSEFIYDASMLDYTAEWQLEITELIGFGSSGNDQQRIPGSWNFEFVVP